MLQLKNILLHYKKCIFLFMLTINGEKYDLLSYTVYHILHHKILKIKEF